jgi:hypothetical protein
MYLLAEFIHFLDISLGGISLILVIGITKMVFFQYINNTKKKNVIFDTLPFD